MASLKFTHAIVCRVPNSFKSKDINFDEAKRQHEAYVRLLRSIGLDVIELPPDEALPDCVYVEDTAVVCNGIALITRPGNPARLKEVDTVRSVLKKELDLPIVEISDESAKLDGGDVLFTGREFFVGLSKWTNEAGARAVAAAFPEYPCTPIKLLHTITSVHVFTLAFENEATKTFEMRHAHKIKMECYMLLKVGDTRHLKAVVTIAGADVLCVSSSKPSQEVLKRIEREATYGYQVLTVPDDAGANVLYVNGTLVHRADDEIPDTCKVLDDKIDYTRHAVNVSELVKSAPSGLSSCCLLLRRSRHIRSL